MSTPLAENIAASKRRFRTHAYAIKVGEQYFGGFGGKPGGTPIVKFREGLCDAKLISGSAPQKVQEYQRRLKFFGHGSTVITIAVIANGQVQS